MKINNSEQIWFEKYRPQLIDDMILPDVYINKFKDYIKNPKNILLVSETPGTGKTSLMNSIVKEGQFESLFINASLENGIDVIRTKVLSFAQTKSFNDKPKIVVFDEMDNLNQNSTQMSLRCFIEEFSTNCRFIGTCNSIKSIIEPLVNRFEVYNFDDIIKLNSKEIVTKIFQRLKFILENENIKFNDSDLLNIIKLKYPSIRGMIGDLQANIYNLELKEIKSVNYDDLINFAKSGNLNGILEIIYNINNVDGFYNFVFKNIKSYRDKIKLIPILAKYHYQSSQVRDKNLNLCACLVEMAPFL